jgi:hypothetical protein
VQNGLSDYLGGSRAPFALACAGDACAAAAEGLQGQQVLADL